MIWHLLRLVTTFLILLGLYFKLDFVFENFENSLLRLSEKKNEKSNSIAFSFCTDFYNLYHVVGCGDVSLTEKLCANKSQAECNEILFEATQTSSSLFALIRNCNLITIFDMRHHSSHMLYVNFGMVCSLFQQKENDTSRLFHVQFRNLHRFQVFRVYMYIHEHRTIPEYLNHYVHVIETSSRGQMEIQFSKKIIFRHLNGAACVNYGVEHKSKDHCLQSCARHFFNYNYYMFLYLESDSVTMFTSTRSEVYEHCFGYCRDRCNTHHFEVDQIKHWPNSQNRTENIDLELWAYRGATKDSLQKVIINFGIFATNILTIIGFLAGFHFYVLHNLLELFVQVRRPIGWFKCVDLSGSLFVLFKFIILFAFILHISSVFRECSKCETFQTLIYRRNLFVEQFTITFCFKLEHLIAEPTANRSLNLKMHYLDEALSSSIHEVFSRVQIYTKNYFKDKRALDDHLQENSKLFFFEDKKCWMVNWRLVDLTGVNMNVNIVKYTTLDNYISFHFAKPYASVYLSEHNLYPNSNITFKDQKLFKKSIRIFSEPFHGKRCLNYTLQSHLKCGSRFECIEDCLVRNVLRHHNTYPTQFKFLPKYKDQFKDEFNITEETIFKRFEIGAKLYAYCRDKFPLKDCRSVVFKVARRNKNALFNDHLDSDHEFVLRLGFDEKIKETHYSFSDYQIANYVLNLFFAYFGTSISGLFSLFERTKLKKLNSMKLLFILVAVYVEYRQLLGLFFERKLIYSTEFNTADSVNIPRVTICYKVTEILKVGRENDFLLGDDSRADQQYFFFLNNRTKNDIDAETKNLTELFHNITFLANDFGAYTTLVGRSLNSLEHLGRSNSLFLVSYLYADYKCYAFELKFRDSGQQTFDIDYVIRFVPTTELIRLHIDEHNYLISKDFIEIRNSTLIKFTHQLNEEDCYKGAYEKRIARVNSIRKQFEAGYGCVSSILSVHPNQRNRTICNDQYKSVEDEILKSLNQVDEFCDCCEYHTYKMIELHSGVFLVALSHSGYKFLKVYRLKLSFVELITYLISIPCFLLGISLFKLVKIIWIRFLVVDAVRQKAV